MRIHERIPREAFQGAFRPMVRNLGTKNVIIRLNENAKTAIPRQTKLRDFMPKLELLCYERNRPGVDEELERLWTVYFEDRLGDREDHFYHLTDELNQNLDGEKIPEDEEKRARAKEQVGTIAAFLRECEFTPEEIDLVFRVKAFDDVLSLYQELAATTP